jgi:2,3-bisphosphoglycerate-independent phosphoglycerate mutase
MNSTNTRPRPVVLVALDAARGPVLTALQQRYPSRQVRLDDSDAISAESLAANQVLRGLIRKAKDMGGRLHLIGLVSDGGVHSSLAHLFALLDIAARARVRVVLHAFLDGVDVPTRSAPRYIAQLEAKLDGGVGRIGTVSGRAFAMDCEAHWDRVEKVYRAMLADNVDRIDSALRGIEEACAFGNPEAFVKPFIVFDYPGVSLVDTALHFNFGAEGARELSQALAGASVNHFARKSARGPFDGRYACMTPYDHTLALPTLFARAPDPSSLPLEALTSAGYRQFHCAEGAPNAIAKTSAAAIRSGQYDFVLADFASPDNTARTGSPVAMEGTVAELVEAARSIGGALVIIGGRDAANEFPVIYVNDADADARLRDNGQFCDLAPTLLELLQLPRTEDAEGVSLLVR